LVAERSGLPVVSIPKKKIKEFFPEYKVTEVQDMLPYVGLDIEYVDEEEIKVEYSPNRPDYSSYYGITRSLKGILDMEVGLPAVTIAKNNKNLIEVDDSVSDIRPFVVAVVAKGCNLDREAITQLLGMQEDLNNGLGRRKNKASVIYHDLSKVKFPLKYLSVNGNERFGHTSLGQFLEKNEVKKENNLPSSTEKFPVLIDSSEEIISLGPIIGSENTKFDSQSKDLIVEVTGTDLQTLFDILAVIVITLSDMNFSIETVDVNTPVETFSCPNMKNKQIKGIRVSLINKILGLKLTGKEIINYLKKSRLDGKSVSTVIDCFVPRYRTDIFRDIDIIEDIGIGYGIFNLGPTVPLFREPGTRSHNSVFFDKVRQTLIGMGLIENLNFDLTSKKVQYDLMNLDYNETNVMEVQGSKSLDRQILRTSLLPSLLESLSHNIHEGYPQRIFEIGKVFSSLEYPYERWSLGGMVAHEDAGYTEIKSILQTLITIGLGRNFRTVPSPHRIYIGGRGADSFSEDIKLGNLGEIHPSIIGNFKIRVPIAAFEINLSKIL
jgi:phenylalanyl-tRNA synthetase beta chain